MSPDRWKRHGRDMAGLLGGRRLPNNGRGPPDVSATTPFGNLASQLKKRAAVPAGRLAPMDQGTLDASASDPDTVPIVVIAHPSPGKETWRHAVLELEHLADVLVPKAGAAHEPGAHQDMRTGKIDRCQLAFANDFGMDHARAREGTDWSRMDRLAQRPESDGAGPRVVENPCETAREGPRKPSSARGNVPERSDSA